MDQQKENHLKVYWLVIIFIFLSLGVASFIKNDWDSNKRVNETIQVSTEDINSQSEIRYTLESRVSFPIKKVSNIKEITFQNLEEANKFFILNENRDLKINQESYTDGSTGYSITYLLNQDMKNVYIAMRNSVLRNNFATTTATRANIGALIFVESDDSFQKVYLQNIKEGETKVYLNIINK